MADPEESAEETPKKKSKMPLILGLVLAIAGGGGGFFAVQSGMLFPSESHAETEAHDEPIMVPNMPDVAFVPIDPIVVSLGQGSGGSHLRFRAQLEVGSAHKEEVEKLMPRVVDVLNGYLRALEPADLESSSILVRLRAQMLRRIQIVTGNSRVNDLLIMEFVLN
ncbi:MULTISPECIES: flagellar basal body-associated protein FliL [unclassified Roseovarius]|uniref:flagellar basal body-associated FliL family protein n=1 Tax=unclassified Roseovarius TaxID=2614913 RepID=UPI00273EC541|nr:MULTISPECIES: flagellar basal body-associated FliL family protein [unclassified Roseovarius]